MSEPFTIAKLKAHPIMGTWSVEGNTQEFPGFLYLEDDNLHLTLYFTIGGHTPFEILERSDPNLMSFAPPNQPTLHGRTKAAGHVTLFHCSQLNYQALNQLDPPQTRLELTLRPTQAWFGGGFVSAEQKYQDLSFRAPGLHNILSTIDVDHRFLVESTPERQSDTHELKKLTGADEAFLVHQAKQPKADIVKGGKTRNVLTHMQGSKKLPLETASYLSLFLTYKLIVLFCIHACVSAGLPLDNLGMMLGNNEMARTACRPLPAVFT